jgi:RNA polymerase sigma factor (sigma-70 family)
VHCLYAICIGRLPRRVAPPPSSDATVGRGVTESENDGVHFSRDALKAVIDACSVKAVHIVRQMGLTDGTADDVVQQCLIELARTWKREGILDRPEFLLYATARRRTVDEFRRRGRMRVDLVANDDLAELASCRLVEAPEFGTGIDAVFTSMDLIAAVRALPVRQQQVLLLRFGLELDIKTVAAFMGCSIGDVKNAQARGLQKLRKSPHLTGSMSSVSEVRK